MSKLTKALTAAAGNAGGDNLYVEDVFSTYLYKGNSGVGSTQSNGLDLSGEGGLVWIKNRDNASANHSLFDTERGGTKVLYSNGTSSEQTGTDGISFLSNGWSTAPNGVYDLNSSGADYASWSFRKAEKFFDVVTYTGNGTTQNISHNLGSTPGCIIVKNTQSSTFWPVYHKDVPNFVGFLNATNAFDTSNTQNFGNNTNPVAPTDSVFTVGQQSTVNSSGETYVAYLFASDAGGFGDDGSESIIKCGSFTTGAQGKMSSPVDCGFEPQWLLVKNSGASENWNLYDVMRGLTVEADAILNPNLSNAEDTGTKLTVTATGFDTPLVNGPFASSATYIYIAIRRPMKTPESGTEVFGVNSYSETNDYQQLTTGNLVDLGWQYLNGDGAKFFTRLLGKGYLNPTSTAAANTSAASAFDFMDGFEPHYANNVSGFNPRMVYGFTRATGFFDVVAYTGDGTTPRNITHNLGAVPEFIVTKRRDVGGSWAVYNPDLGITSSSGIRLNTDDGWGYSQLTRYPSTPTSTVYTVGNDSDVNSSGNTFISYLWTTLAGVSKVGSYTGTGSNVDVDCGFAAGARLVIIKRYGTSTTGDWYIWDSARGIVAGNDPYLLLNSTAAEVTSTDYIDPLASGFTVTSSAPAALNASGGNYIFLAIA